MGGGGGRGQRRGGNRRHLGYLGFNGLRVISYLQPRHRLQVLNIGARASTESCRVLFLLSASLEESSKSLQLTGSSFISRRRRHKNKKNKKQEQVGSIDRVRAPTPRLSTHEPLQSLPTLATRGWKYQSGPQLGWRWWWWGRGKVVALKGAGGSNSRHVEKATKRCKKEGGAGVAPSSGNHEASHHEDATHNKVSLEFSTQVCCFL